MGKKLDLDRLRSINVTGRFRGTSRVRRQRDKTGRISTIEIDHPDGSTEAIARPRTVKEKIRISGGTPDA